MPIWRRKYVLLQRKLSVYNLSVYDMGTMYMYVLLKFTSHRETRNNIEKPLIGTSSLFFFF